MLSIDLDVVAAKDWDGAMAMDWTQALLVAIDSVRVPVEEVSLDVVAAFDSDCLPALDSDRS